MLSTVQFMEEFIKLEIIKQFAAQMIPMEDLRLEYWHGLAKPIMTMCNIEGSEDQRKFSLCNVGFWNCKTEKTEIYNIDGIVSLLNNGRIVIVDYDIHK